MRTSPKKETYLPTFKKYSPLLYDIFVLFLALSLGGGSAALAFVYGISAFYFITFVSAVIVLFCIFVLYIQFREILCTWAERREY